MGNFRETPIHPSLKMTTVCLLVGRPLISNETIPSPSPGSSESAFRSQNLSFHRMHIATLARKSDFFMKWSSIIKNGFVLLTCQYLRRMCALHFTLTCVVCIAAWSIAAPV